MHFYVWHGVLCAMLFTFSTCVINDSVEERISVENHSVEFSFKQVLGLLGEMEWLKKNGYKVVLPQHLAFKEFEEHPEKLKTLDNDKYFKIFASEIYKSLPIAPVQKMVHDNARTFLTVLNRFQNLNYRWGFKVFPQYKIYLNQYGPGGSYHRDGTIDIRADENGIPNTSCGGY